MTWQEFAERYSLEVLPGLSAAAGLWFVRTVTGSHNVRGAMEVAWTDGSVSTDRPTTAWLGTAGSVSWLSAPSLLAPLFDRPRIEARVESQRSHTDQRVDQECRRVDVGAGQAHSAANQRQQPNRQRIERAN